MGIPPALCKFLGGKREGYFQKTAVVINTFYTFYTVAILVKMSNCLIEIHWWTVLSKLWHLSVFLIINPFYYLLRYIGIFFQRLETTKQSQNFLVFSHGR